MADESLQTPDQENEILDPDTQIPVRLDSLEADGTRPQVGDQVTIKVDATVKKIENDYAYVQADAINDTDLNDILAETAQDDDEGQDDMMRRMTSQADAQGTPLGGGGAFM